MLKSVWCSVNQSKDEMHFILTAAVGHTRHSLPLLTFTALCSGKQSSETCSVSLSYPIELMLQFARNKSSWTLLKNALSEANPKNSQERSLFILG